MAVRKKVAVRPERSSGTATEFPDLLLLEEEEPDTELQLRIHRIVTKAVNARVVKEWAKGVLAFAAVIAGAIMCIWDLRTWGFTYWFIHISGLVVFCVGLAFAVEFIKLLMAGDLIKATVALMRAVEIKEWMRVFIALLSIGAGTCLIIKAEELDLAEWVSYSIGIVLVAGGGTYFWTRTKMFDREHNSRKEEG